MTGPITLLCLPHAGAGPSLFNAWTPTDALVPRALSLPGREKRFTEPPATTFGHALQLVAAQVEDQEGDIALFGHSLGALLAFELAGHLEAQGRRVVRLFASGAPGPHLTPRWSLADLDDDAFVAGVQRLTGFTHPALAEHRLRPLLLPALRADFRVHEDYTHTGTTLRAPITTLRGTEDLIVSAAEALTWDVVTDGGCRTREVPGGHMYLLDQWPELLHHVVHDLDRAAATT